MLEEDNLHLVENRVDERRSSPYAWVEPAVRVRERAQRALPAVTTSGGGTTAPGPEMSSEARRLLFKVHHLCLPQRLGHLHQASINPAINFQKTALPVGKFGFTGC